MGVSKISIFSLIMFFTSKSQVVDNASIFMQQLSQYLKFLSFECNIDYLFYLFKSRPPYQVEKKGNGCARGWCVVRRSLLQDGCKVSTCEV